MYVEWNSIEVAQFFSLLPEVKPLPVTLLTDSYWGDDLNHGGVHRYREQDAAIGWTGT